MERRCTSGLVECRQGDGSNGMISGYAAVFYDGTPETEFELWDGAVERVFPEAFKAVGESDVMALFNHQPSLVLGRSGAKTLRLAVDKKGLRYEIDPGETPQFLHSDDQVIGLTRPHQAVVCNTMWALTDFTEANGATRIVPSQLFGRG